MLVTLAMAINCHLISALEDRQFAEKNDAFIGTCGADEIEAKVGVRFVNGRAGNDIFSDKTLTPTQIQGGTGNDTFYAGTGVDVYYGGAGFETYIFDGKFGNDVIADLHIHQGDRLLFISYQKDSLNVGTIKKNLSKISDQDVLIDLSAVIGFEGSSLKLLNMSQAQFDKLSIEVREVK